MTARNVEYLADTGFLICFGSIPGGRKLFLSAFAGNVAASPTIRFELNRKHSDQRTYHHIRTAIDSFVGTNHDVLLDITFHRRDEPERDNALDYLKNTGSLPAGPLNSFPLTTDGHEPGARYTGKHGGEAEIVAIAVRRLLPILMNETDGTTYAKARGIKVESFALSLGRLLGAHTAQELFQIWKRVDTDHDTGAVVPGPQFFRQPGPSPAAIVARASGLIR